MSRITLVICCVLSFAQTGDDHSSTKTHSRATFELEVKRSDVMKLGKSKLVSVIAFASVMHRKGPGKFLGIDIFFAPQTTEGAVLKSAKEVKRGNCANLNLLLDTTGRVTQVNMTVVVPGRTVARTVAWKAEDLNKYFSDVNLKGRRVVLKSKGIYDDPESESEQASLHWDVDIDVPVSNDSEQ
jgi:hypothetical protein